ncbi:Uncharacterised protein [Serratia fonticola]|nr:Uncharacterised protein [Serratia fonticola]
MMIMVHYYLLGIGYIPSYYIIACETSVSVSGAHHIK